MGDLIKKGTIYKCRKCNKELFKLKEDVMNTDRFDSAKLEGIDPQPDPKPKDVAMCISCGGLIDVYGLDRVEV